jgi:Xaa-Pro aminopeptidase
MNKPTFSLNKRQLVAMLPSGSSLIIIAGNGLLSRSSDTSFAFRQDSNFLYLSGVIKPNSALLIDTENLKTYLVKPNKSKVEEIFDDPFESDIDLNYSDIDEIISQKKAVEIIISKSKIGDVFFNLPAKSNSHGLYSNPHRKYWKGIITRCPVSVKDIRPYLGRLRMIKKSYEIEYIKEAIKITKDTIYNLNISELVGQSEEYIANQITKEFTNKSTCNAYAPIVALDSNAAVLHHLPDNKTFLKNNSTILFDVGAEFKGYAADISRTMYLGSDKRIKKLINDLSDAQKFIISKVKPGIYWRELQQISKEALFSVARSSNFFGDKSIDELFPHSIGHFVGLDVHDAGDYTEQLSENMIITIEPGLYSKIHGIGIRVEDDILITKTGSVIL